MRTTVTLDPDVAAAVEQLRRERGIGPSEAVNELVRRGLNAGEGERRPFVQKVSDLGRARLPLNDGAGLLEALERSDHA